MRLSSTFIDFYDPWFGRTGPVLRRQGGNSGPPKPDQFRILEAAGFLTPPHGPVREVLGSWWEAEKTWVRAVVAYTDPAAHCTEGKALWWKQCPELNLQPKMGYDERNERSLRNFETYCSAFLGPYPQALSGDLKGVSLRRLQIGPHVFWVEYRSTESWMSNFGEGSCEVVGVEKDAGFHPTLRHPLFAIDFVLGREMYAVDFNLAPGIRGSGVEKNLSGPEAVAALETAYAEGVWEGQPE